MYQYVAYKVSIKTDCKHYFDKNFLCVKHNRLDLSVKVNVILNFS